ncbi:putative dynein light chain, type, dynein light chain superfamily protein [Plasmopara halstedii]
MVFCKANFLVSKTPVASVALQAAAKQAVNDVAKRTTGIRNFAAALQSQAELSLGLGWHIIVGNDFAVDLRYRKGACVLLFSNTSKMKVMLYRTTSSLKSTIENEHKVFLEASDQVSIKKKSMIYECSMEDEMRNLVLDKTWRLYNYYKGIEDNEAKIAQALKHSLTFKYGPTWQVVVSSSHELCCLPITDKGTHADFTLEKLRVVVYRHAGTELDRQIDMTLFAKRVAFVLAIICLLLYGFMSLNPSMMVEKCKGNSSVMEASLIDGMSLPEGCTKEDIKRATDYAWWKTAAIVGISGFTMLASIIRMYSKTLTPKYKRS